MNNDVMKLLRTLQVNFPYFLDAKFTLMRLYRNKFGIPFEEDFHALQLFPDTGEALFLDVGANRGQSTDAILMKVKNCRVQLFEPNPLLSDKLSRQYGSDKRVTINQFGLGDRSSEQALYIPFYKRWMFDGLASFDQIEARDWLSERIFFYRERNLSLQEFKCNIKRLDDLNVDPFFIKIDVQGYELQVLMGGEQKIRTCEPILLVESPSEKIIDYLKRFGYQFYAFEKAKFIPGVQGKQNTFFMTENKASLVKRHICDPQRSTSGVRQLKPQATNLQSPP
jgi:FkbM family methyltransferase